MNKNKLIQLLLGGAMAMPLLAGADEGLAGEGDRPATGAMHGDFRGGPRGAMPPGGPGAPGMPFLRGLDLSEAQEDKVFQLMHAQAPYMREQQRAHEKAMRALHEMGDADKFDEAAASKLAQAAAQAEANLVLARIRTHQKVMALLTPEQRAQLAERKARFQHRGGFQ